ncbi:glycoside hydrolase family 99-like domain-containing protein [Deinococcus roseus]|uniref:Glycosyltransferase WbsX n=1 Tax=Deinococcus roseus TaxID=392414 RepID=A0ABQ2CVY5_9DEIO|nr:glycoside hydrolase family 99-like domain-containing protein [Deinococcus roseus]GGJ25787.1 hypothetical protein GCM10008938_09880 [Deinococcus roseus]
MRSSVRKWIFALFLLSVGCAQQQKSAPDLKVGAWYFTAWHAGNHIHLDSTQKIYGSSDVWGGIRDHAEGKDPFGWKTDYAAREPQLGFYNQMDPAVIRQHLQWARKYNLDFFGIYWYWNSVLHAPDDINKPFQVLKEVDAQEKLPFFLAPFVLGAVTLQEWTEKVVPAFVQDARDQNYYRVFQRPLVAVLYTGLPNADLKAGMDALRSQMKKAFGQDPILLFTLYDDTATPEVLQYIFDQVGIDGFTCLHFPPHAPAEPYTETLKRWEAGSQKLAKYPHMPCISVGFDPRPWYKVGTDPLGNYNTGISAQAFRSFLPRVRTYLRQHLEKTSGHVMVYAFNEWGEGGILEPSRPLGDAYLRALSEALK